MDTQLSQSLESDRAPALIMAPTAVRGVNPRVTVACGLALVCVAALLWGTVGVAGQMLSTSTVDPTHLGWMRTVLGGLALLALAHCCGWSGGALERGHARFLLMFAIGCAVFQITLFTGFRVIGVTVTVAVTVVLPPVLVAAGSALVLPDARSLCTVSAILTAGAGVGLALLGAGGLETIGQAFDAFGAGLLAANALAFILMATALRHLARSLHPVKAAGAGLLSASLVLFVAMHVLPGQEPFIAALATLQSRDLGVILYIGIVATGGAYAAFTAGMKLCPRPAAGFAATMIEPVFAAVLAAMLIGEALSRAAVAGCVLMLAAMGLLFVSEIRSRKPARS
jgi:DME family drug/metabolite transporter